MKVLFERYRQILKSYKETFFEENYVSLKKNSLKMTQNVIYTDPGTLGGTPVFQGTRVPIQSFFDYLGNGETLQEFIDNFPTVSKEQAIKILRIAEKLLITTKNLDESIA